jgi:phenylpropionate dioxygenase-like ring-hydroxylating dioxygenase large terminal subunit
LDGSLHHVPAEDTFKRLDKSRLGLLELQLEEWMGFVFVRFGGTGTGVGEAMQPFADEAAHHRFEAMKPWSARSSSTHSFNWKLFAENDAEGYHIPSGHPGLHRLFGSSYSDSVDPSEQTGGDDLGIGSRAFSQLQERESSKWGERAYQRILPVVDHLPKELQRAWIYYAVFPTAVLQVSPDLVDCYQVLPRGPDECELLTFSVALEDERREMRAARYLTSRIVRQVVREDLDFCHWTNAGVRSDGYSGGVLSELEGGVRHFYDQICELIPVARCSEKPTRLSGHHANLADINQAMRSDG